MAVTETAIGSLSLLDPAHCSADTATFLPGAIRGNEAEFSAIASANFFLSSAVLANLEKLHLKVEAAGAQFFMPILSARNTLRLNVTVAAHRSASLFILTERSQRDLQLTLELREESRLDFFSLLKNAEVELDCSMMLAQGAQGLLSGLTQAEGKTHTKINIRIHHLQRNGKSKQAFYSYARDSAEVSFTGSIVVDPGADGTVAHQLHRGTLLAKTARIDARPFLNILHDDVRCTHGSTVGFIDEAAVRYLRTRGLDQKIAEAMLVESFERQFFDALPPGSPRKFFGLAEEES